MFLNNTVLFLSNSIGAFDRMFVTTCHCPVLGKEEETFFLFIPFHHSITNKLTQKESVTDAERRGTCEQGDLHLTLLFKSTATTDV